MGVYVFTFHRAMQCWHCQRVHHAGEVTHALMKLATPADQSVALMPICNGCHTAELRWLLGRERQRQ